MKYIPEACTPLFENTNKYLIYLYVLSCATGVVSCIFFSLVWSHWHSTLNTCFVTPDCGCVLYVSTTINIVTGGDIRLCTFITYTQLGVALISFGMACYYCARSVQDETRRARAAHPKGGRRYSPAIRDGKNLDPCLTPIALTSALISILLLCVAYMYTEGYYKTCSQYRRTVARNLKASGNLVSVIYERLSCDSVLDLMDYTHPNTPRRDPRGGIVNSAFLLQSAMVSGWIHFILWLLLLVYNTLLARRRSCGGILKPDDSHVTDAAHGVLGTETAI